MPARTAFTFFDAGCRWKSFPSRSSAWIAGFAVVTARRNCVRFFRIPVLRIAREEIAMTPHPLRLRGLLTALFLVLVAGGAAAAGRTVPDPRFTSIDPVAVGSPLGVPIGGAPAGFDVSLRDINNAPRPREVVSLRIGIPGLRLYAAQNAGTTVDCAQGTISRVTDAQGGANFAPRFGGWNDLNVIEVFSGTETFGFVKARSPDYDGDGRVGLGDFALFGSDLISNPAAVRSDFDLSGSTGLGDFALFGAQLLGASPQSLCP
jgi:hypothetical protein